MADVERQQLAPLSLFNSGSEHVDNGVLSGEKVIAPNGLQKLLIKLAEVVLKNKPLCIYDCMASALEAELDRRTLKELQYNHYLSHGIGERRAKAPLPSPRKGKADFSQKATSVLEVQKELFTKAFDEEQKVVLQEFGNDDGIDLVSGKEKAFVFAEENTFEYEKVNVPKGLQKLLVQLAEVVLRNKPLCIYECLASTLESELDRRTLRELQFSDYSRSKSSHQSLVKSGLTVKNVDEVGDAGDKVNLFKPSVPQTWNISEADLDSGLNEVLTPDFSEEFSHARRVTSPRVLMTGREPVEFDTDQQLHAISEAMYVWNSRFNHDMEDINTVEDNIATVEDMKSFGESSDYPDLPITVHNLVTSSQEQLLRGAPSKGFEQDDYQISGKDLHPNHSDSDILDNLETVALDALLKRNDHLDEIGHMSPVDSRNNWSNFEVPDEVIEASNVSDSSFLFSSEYSEDQNESQYVDRILTLDSYSDRPDDQIPFAEAKVNNFEFRQNRGVLWNEKEEKAYADFCFFNAEPEVKSALCDEALTEETLPYPLHQTNDFELLDANEAEDEFELDTPHELTVGSSGVSEVIVPVKNSNVFAQPMRNLFSMEDQNDDANILTKDDVYEIVEHEECLQELDLTARHPSGIALIDTEEKSVHELNRSSDGDYVPVVEKIESSIVYSRGTQVDLRRDSDLQAEDELAVMVDADPTDNYKVPDITELDRAPFTVTKIDAALQVQEPSVSSDYQCFSDICHSRDASHLYSISEESECEYSPRPDIDEYLTPLDSSPEKSFVDDAYLTPMFPASETLQNEEAAFKIHEMSSYSETSSGDELTSESATSINDGIDRLNHVELSMQNAAESLELLNDNDDIDYDVTDDEPLAAESKPDFMLNDFSFNHKDDLETPSNETRYMGQFEPYTYDCTRSGNLPVCEQATQDDVTSNFIVKDNNSETCLNRDDESEAVLAKEAISDNFYQLFRDINDKRSVENSGDMPEFSENAPCCHSTYKTLPSLNEWQVSHESDAGITASPLPFKNASHHGSVDVLSDPNFQEKYITEFHGSASAADGSIKANTEDSIGREILGSHSDSVALISDSEPKEFIIPQQAVLFHSPASKRNREQKDVLCFSNMTDTDTYSPIDQLSNKSTHDQLYLTETEGQVTEKGVIVEDKLILPHGNNDKGEEFDSNDDECFMDSYRPLRSFVIENRAKSSFNRLDMHHSRDVEDICFTKQSSKETEDTDLNRMTVPTQSNSSSAAQQNRKDIRLFDPTDNSHFHENDDHLSSDIADPPLNCKPLDAIENSNLDLKSISAIIQNDDIKDTTQEHFANEAIPLEWPPLPSDLDDFTKGGTEMNNSEAKDNESKMQVFEPANPFKEASGMHGDGSDIAQVEQQPLVYVQPDSDESNNGPLADHEVLMEDEWPPVPDFVNSKDKDPNNFECNSEALADCLPIKMQSETEISDDWPPVPDSTLLYKSHESTSRSKLNDSGSDLQGEMIESPAESGASDIATDGEMIPLLSNFSTEEIIVASRLVSEIVFSAQQSFDELGTRTKCENDDFSERQYETSDVGDHNNSSDFGSQGSSVDEPADVNFDSDFEEACIYWPPSEKKQVKSQLGDTNISCETDEAQKTNPPQIPDSETDFQMRQFCAIASSAFTDLTKVTGSQAEMKSHHNIQSHVELGILAGQSRSDINTLQYGSSKSLQHLEVTELSPWLEEKVKEKWKKDPVERSASSGEDDTLRVLEVAGIDSNFNVAATTEPALYQSKYVNDESCLKDRCPHKIHSETSIFNNSDAKLSFDLPKMVQEQESGNRNEDEIEVNEVNSSAKQVPLPNTDGTQLASEYQVGNKISDFNSDENDSCYQFESTCVRKIPGDQEIGCETTVEDDVINVSEDGSRVDDWTKESETGAIIKSTAPIFKGKKVEIQDNENAQSQSNDTDSLSYHISEDEPYWHLISEKEITPFIASAFPEVEDLCPSSYPDLCPSSYPELPVSESNMDRLPETLVQACLSDDQENQTSPPTARSEMILGDSETTSESRDCERQDSTTDTSSEGFTKKVPLFKPSLWNESESHHGVSCLHCRLDQVSTLSSPDSMSVSLPEADDGHTEIGKILSYKVHDASHSQPCRDTDPNVTTADEECSVGKSQHFTQKVENNSLNVDAQDTINEALDQTTQDLSEDHEPIGLAEYNDAKLCKMLDRENEIDGEKESQMMADEENCDTHNQSLLPQNMESSNESQISPDSSLSHLPSTSEPGLESNYFYRIKEFNTELDESEDHNDSKEPIDDAVLEETEADDDDDNLRPAIDDNVSELIDNNNNISTNEESAVHIEITDSTSNPEYDQDFNSTNDCSQGKKSEVVYGEENEESSQHSHSIEHQSDAVVGNFDDAQNLGYFLHDNNCDQESEIASDQLDKLVPGPMKDEHLGRNPDSDNSKYVEESSDENCSFDTEGNTSLINQQTKYLGASPDAHQGQEFVNSQEPYDVWYGNDHFDEKVPSPATVSTSGVFEDTDNISSDSSRRIGPVEENHSEYKDPVAITLRRVESETNLAMKLKGESDVDLESTSSGQQSVDISTPFDGNVAFTQQKMINEDPVIQCQSVEPTCISAAVSKNCDAEVPAQATISSSAEADSEQIYDSAADTDFQSLPPASSASEVTKTDASVASQTGEVSENAISHQLANYVAEEESETMIDMEEINPGDLEANHSLEDRQLKHETDAGQNVFKQNFPEFQPENYQSEIDSTEVNDVPVHSDTSGYVAELGKVNSSVVDVADSHQPFEDIFSSPDDGSLSQTDLSGLKLEAVGEGDLVEEVVNVGKGNDTLQMGNDRVGVGVEDPNIDGITDLLPSDVDEKENEFEDNKDDDSSFY